ncbi:MAG TPA: NINE protein [Chitinophagaceae bacterium]|jgi:TM2 domain-containing membrane protein YozV|nr:NINE protein [Chitinophagaceae bacterium]
MDQKLLMMLPNLQPEELYAIQNLFQEMSESQQQQFIMLYQGRRKEQQTITLLTLVGFLGFAGLQRFVLNEVAWGVLYFLTAGFCFIGTIYDLFNVRRMTTDFNLKQAYEAATMVKMYHR